MEKKKRIIRDIIMIVAGIAMLVAFIIIGSQDRKEADNKTDSIKFAEEYSTVNKENVFVYKNAKEIIDILEKGTGLVYLGFPECPWCQSYVKILNEVAKENDVTEIYYFNIKEDRADDTDNYKKIVSLLEDNLQKNDEGNYRVYVPDFTGVKNGEIVGHDNETSLDTKGIKNPDEYWTKERTEDLKKRLKKIISEVKVCLCTDCNV